MDSTLSRHEISAMIGGGLLAIALVLPWYHADNERARIAGESGPGSFSAWEVHDVQRWLLLAAAAAPFILAWIIIRGHALSWSRGEMTAVVSIAAFGLVTYAGIIDRPGEPSGLIGLEPGYWVALLGVMLMLTGSALRASQHERPRKPPGVV